MLLLLGQCSLVLIAAAKKVAYGKSRNGTTVEASLGDEKMV
jgi:hypothetical protein